MGTYVVVRFLGGSMESMAGWFKYAYLLFVHLHMSQSMMILFSTTLNNNIKKIPMIKLFIKWKIEEKTLNFYKLKNFYKFKTWYVLELKLSYAHHCCFYLEEFYLKCY